MREKKLDWCIITYKTAIHNYYSENIIASLELEIKYLRKSIYNLT
jgi:hypothetical protein